MHKFVRDLKRLALPDLRCPGWPPKRGKSENDPEIAVLHISDVQFGKKNNNYNSDEARKRLFRLALHAGKILDGRNSKELRLYLGGDIVEGGGIFPGQSWEVDSTVFTQAIHGASSALSRLVIRLLHHVEKIKVVSVRGNHGRDIDFGPVNWDEVTYEVMKRNLLGGQELFPERRKLAKRVKFSPIGNWYQLDRVFNWGNLLIHGDQFKGNFAGSGFRNKVSGWIDAIPEPWDYVWFGHFHTFAMGTINKRVFLANGTIESGNEYAREQMAAIGDPVQRMSFFNAKYGLIADYPIYLDERRPNRK